MAVLTGAAASPLNAQQLEEVVVTATKRSESLLDVSLSISAISGAETRLLNINDIKDLISFTPGISGNSKDSFLDTVNVRGIRTELFGNGAEPSVGFYVNGQYQGRTGAAVSSLYDVERSEVLRGPQGFLFPRGAVTGAFNVITEKANTEAVEGYGEIDVGERGVFVFEGAVNVPLTDNLAMRVAGIHTEEDGYVENLAGGDDLIAHDNDSLRVSFRYETEKLTGDLILQYDDRDQAGSIYRVTGEGPNFNSPKSLFLNGGEPWEVGTDRQVNINDEVNSRDISEIFSVGLLLEYDLGWATISSLTHYKDHDYEYGEDFDGLPITLYEYEQFQSGDYFEQELRLTSQSEGPLDWYVGASIYQEDIDTIFGYIQSEDVYCDLYLNYYYAGDAYRGCTAYYEDYAGYEFTPSTNGLINDYNETLGKYQGYSTYVELRYQFSPSFDVAAGVRYQYDERDYSMETLPDLGGSQFSGGIGGLTPTPEGPVADSADWDGVTYRLAANWHPTDSTLLFATISTGFKPGGYDNIGFENRATGAVVSGQALPGRDRPAAFDEETVTSYEVGYKGRFLDGRINLAWTAFLYEYKDLQAFFSEANPNGPGFRTVAGNVGVLDGWGSEIDLSAALTDNITLRLGGSWLDSEARDVQAFCGAAVDLGATEDACEGEPLPLAPEFTAFAILNGSFPVGSRGGELFGNLAYSWEDDAKGDWIPEELSKQTVRFLDQTDIVVGYQEENWMISGYVENVFNNSWEDGTFGEDFDGSPYPQYVFGPSRPRTAGVRASYSF
ncbi:TonB-dependent receptor [Pseudohaliea sp.]|uniref:TonB-dependent receptor n=1 Tax=Pseudohaliea sp. TaxID=2740289 RepID=UPI0032F05DFC